MSDNEGHQSNKQHHRKKTKQTRKGAKKDFFDLEKNKPDEETQTGSKAGKPEDDDYQKARNRNPKAFALQSFVAAERQFRR